MTTPLPNWLLDLINVVAAFEDEHDFIDAGHAGCMAKVLDAVPADVRRQADAVRGYLAQAGQATSTPDAPQAVKVHVHPGAWQRPEEPAVRYVPVICEPWIRA